MAGNPKSWLITAKQDVIESPLTSLLLIIRFLGTLVHPLAPAAETLPYRGQGSGGDSSVHTRGTWNGYQSYLSPAERLPV